MEFNDCHAGHKMHSRVQVETNLGLMTVYDWELYKGQAGIYCTGQDDVSRTLIKTGTWEQGISGLVTALLTSGVRTDAVVDIGCNVGWYSRMASFLGYPVVALDGNKEHLFLTELNAPKAVTGFVWFDKDTAKREVNRPIIVMKIDIEGNEEHAIRAFEDAFKDRLVKNLIMEVSPVFNGSYPALIEKIVGYGYQALEVDGRAFDFNFNFDQKDLWFRTI